jgi:predicted Zn finger-like uncharacterized protein
MRRDISLPLPQRARENERVVVQCPTCASKFRIGDEKVTDRGVRVRCTSCKGVFQVRKSGVVAAAAAPPSAARPEEQPEDPFAIDAKSGDAVEPPPPSSPQLPPTVSGEHVMLGAFKTNAKDPFDGMDMGAPDPCALELATEPKRDKLAEALKAESNARSKADEAPAAHRAAPVREAEPAAGRTLVSAVLTGVLAAAVVLAALAVPALRGREAMRWLGLDEGTDLVAASVTSGVYDTATGKRVFYVRGRVENRSGKAQAAPVVTAELLRDGAPEARAEAVVGAEPTPEDVWSLDSAADAGKLARTLEAAAPGKKLGPGESVPFFALMAEPPQDLRSRKLRVRVEAVDRTAQAKGAGK